MMLRRTIMPAERITVTFPPDLVQEIDRQEPNRSKFIQEAVRQELERRRQFELERSLKNPHPETKETANLGLRCWIEGLPDEDDDLLDPQSGTDICWIPGKGWHEVNG
jgi:Arc/MetJ-type ribon-helix-helix transcriptional regulator